MRFAKVVFRVAGIWGIVVLTPLYFLVDLTGRRYGAPVDYPQFFYGFLSVAMAWQIAFLVIGSSPARFRPMMIPSVVEKLSHVAGVAVLYGEGRLSPVDATAAAPDLVLGVLFIVAFAVTPKFNPAAWSAQLTAVDHHRSTAISSPGVEKHDRTSC